MLLPNAHSLKLNKNPIRMESWKIREIIQPPEIPHTKK
jgi:hypothetical protein